MSGGGYNNPLLQTLWLNGFLDSQDINNDVKAKIFKSAVEEYRRLISPYGDTQKVHLEKPDYSCQSIRYDDI